MVPDMLRHEQCGAGQAVRPVSRNRAVIILKVLAAAGSHEEISCAESDPFGSVLHQCIMESQQVDNYGITSPI